jgi:hypothetical protein
VTAVARKQWQRSFVRIPTCLARQCGCNWCPLERMWLLLSARKSEFTPSLSRTYRKRRQDMHRRGASPREPNRLRNWRLGTGRQDEFDRYTGISRSNHAIPGDPRWRSREVNRFTCLWPGGSTARHTVFAGRFCWPRSRKTRRNGSRTASRKVRSFRNERRDRTSWIGVPGRMCSLGGETKENDHANDTGG